MEIAIREIALSLVHPFTIARGTEHVAHSLVMRIHWNGLEGLGETSPASRYGETVESVLAYFSSRPPAAGDPYDLEAQLAGIPPAARCALDVALYDLIGKDVGRPLWRLFGLDPAKTPATSFTIGIDSIETMLRKIDEAGDVPILKIKLGAGSEIETLEAVRSRYGGTIRIDANEGWSPEQAVALLDELARFDIEFCEQPIAAGQPAALRYVHERSPIPIVADEDAKDAGDLLALAGCVHGVNVKLVKTGGIRGALAMIHTARALGLKVMLGCMVESAILATAAAHLSPLADWADLDGPLLIANDPFEGLSYDRGKIVLPNRPGLGVRERTAA